MFQLMRGTLERRIGSVMRANFLIGLDQKNMVWTGDGEAPLSGGRIEDGSINQMEQKMY